jgi:Chaperone of endosialidase
MAGKVILSALTVLLGASLAHAQGNAFTYQGRLASGAVPADGSYDFEFRLFDALAGGAQQGCTMAIPGVVVTGGLFTVGLNFGTAFDGSQRFLEVAVRPVGGGAYTTIAPRQPITSAPYSVRSATAGNALQLGGMAASQYVLTTDPRMTDDRNPLPGSSHYVQNTASPQAASFNVTGGGTVGGTLSGGTVNAGNQYNLGGARILSGPGTANIIVGIGAGTALTTGQQNAFFGFEAGLSSATATRNTFLGSGAGRVATGGSNTFVGGSAGVNTTTGTANVFVGAAAGNGNTTGQNNVFVGAFTAQDSVTTADDNVLVGFSAGRTNRGAGNTFVGKDSGRANTTGDNNAFFGFQSGFANTSGAANTFLGTIAGQSNLNGQLNSFVGWGAGSENTSGSANVFMGYFAGDSNTIGGANTLVGAQADVGAPDLTNATAIGAGSIAHASDTIVLGRDQGQDAVHVWGVLRVGLEGSGSLDVCRNGAVRLATCSSSLRYKSDVSPFTRGLDVVAQLRPIRFRWRDSGLPDVGFAAEEVERVEPLLATYGENGEVEGVKYKQVTTVLVTAVQELERENDALKAALERQRRETAGLRAALCRAGLLAEGCE